MKHMKKEPCPWYKRHKQATLFYGFSGDVGSHDCLQVLARPLPTVNPGILELERREGDHWLQFMFIGAAVDNCPGVL